VATDVRDCWHRLYWFNPPWPHPGAHPTYKPVDGRKLPQRVATFYDYFWPLSI